MTKNASDKELWNGIKNDNKSSLTQLFQRYYFYLIKTGFNYSQNVETLKDAANDIFFHLWQNRQSLSDVENINAYLNTSFRNRVFLLLRQEMKNTKRLAGWHTEQPQIQFSYEEIIVAMQVKKEQKEKLRRALDGLSPRQKEYLQMKFYEGLSYEQIAAQTGQVVKTVYNTVYEAIKVLRSEIKL